MSLLKVLPFLMGFEAVKSDTSSSATSVLMATAGSVGIFNQIYAQSVPWWSAVDANNNS